MNTRQAGAFTELIRKEERARDLWNATHGAAFAAARQQSVAVAPASPLSTTTNINDPNPARVVDVMVPRAVPTTRLVEVDALTEREETYTEVHKVPATRKKDIYVKKSVEETYEKEVPVTKTRKVQVPTKKLKPVTDWVTVEVPEQRSVDPKEQSRIDREWRETGFNGTSTFSAGSTQGFSSPQKTAASSSQSFPATASMSGSLGNYSFNPSQSFTSTGSQPVRLGFKLRSSSTAPGTVVVYEVEPNTPAAQAGVRVRDIILSCQGHGISSLQDFKNAVRSTSVGPILVHVKRGADRFVLTLQRQ